MSFANGLATFLAVIAGFLLVFAWALHHREEAKMRLAFAAVALLVSVLAAGSWAAGRWF